MTESDPSLAPLRRFRLMAVRISLVISAAGAGAFYLWNGAAAQGFLMGGIAGILSFWVEAVRLEKVASRAGANVKFASLAWTTFRFVIFGAVLIRAYTLDRERMLGLLGAAAGLFVIRFVITFLGITGMDLNEGRDSQGK